MRRGLVISGGGAKGAFPLGAINYLADRGHRWDAFYGTSTGSIIAALMAQNDRALLTHIWLDTITGNGSIYKKWGWGIPGLRTVIGYKKGGLYNPKPIKRLLDQYVSWDRVKHPLSVFMVNLQTGALCMGHRGRPLADCVLASCSFPPAFPPVKIGLDQFADGGIREIAPLAQAIADGCEEITLMLCSPVDMKTEERQFKTLVDVIERSLGIAVNEIFANDVNRTAEGVRIKTIQPERDLIDTLDFDPVHTRAMFNHGAAIAAREFGGKA